MLLPGPDQGFLHIQSYGPFVAAPLLAVADMINSFAFERIVIIERRGFGCRRCGYDLQGQTEPRCPECGTQFDPDERARIQARIGSAQPPRRRLAWIVVLINAALLLATGMLVYRTSQAARKRIPTTAPAATAPTVDGNAQAPSEDLSTTHQLDMVGTITAGMMQATMTAA
ncbi:MAG: hypothetical protein O7F76_10160 [Planctomycetota bacterium]|nr:hypothetical protein [Planctomycetota bacterium]